MRYRHTTKCQAIRTECGATISHVMISGQRSETKRPCEEEPVVGTQVALMCCAGGNSARNMEHTRDQTKHGAARNSWCPCRLCLARVTERGETTTSHERLGASRTIMNSERNGADETRPGHKCGYGGHAIIPPPGRGTYRRRKKKKKRNAQLVLRDLETHDMQFETPIAATRANDGTM